MKTIKLTDVDGNEYTVDVGQLTPVEPKPVRFWAVVSETTLEQEIDGTWLYLRTSGHNGASLPEVRNDCDFLMPAEVAALRDALNGHLKHVGSSHAI